MAPNARIAEPGARVRGTVMTAGDPTASQPVLEIEASERAGLAPLFGQHRHLRVLIDAILQGTCGRAWANAGGRARVAELTVGAFTFFGGDPAHPLVSALVERLPEGRILPLAGDGWREAVQRVHGGRIELEPRVSYSATHLDPEHLQSLQSRIPHGFQIKRLDLDLARRIRDEVHPDLLLAEALGSAADFIERGVGFCALAGGRMVCGATSAFVSDRAIEIQINTVGAYRRLGLATAVGAALVRHCLVHGIEPHWDAGDPASERVAEKLGYVRDSTYDWWLLRG